MHLEKLSTQLGSGPSLRGSDFHQRTRKPSHNWERLDSKLQKKTHAPQQTDSFGDWNNQLVFHKETNDSPNFRFKGFHEC